MKEIVEIDNIMDIVNWFLFNQSMTHKKLQKMLYFSYGIYLVRNNYDENNIRKRLFNNRFQAWVHGPVDPMIYSSYKKSGVNLISVENIDNIHLPKKIIDLLNEVMEKFSKYDGDQLEAITHTHISWKKARKNLASWEPSNNPIDDKDIFLAFKGV